MRTVRFLLKRFVAQRLLGLAVVVTLAFCVGVVVAGPIYAGAAREAILTSAVSSSAVTTTNARLRVFGSTGFDFEAADAAVTRAVGPLPVRTLVRAGLADVHLRGPGGPVSPLIFRDGAARHLPFEGDAPGDGEVALPLITADALGLGIGDTVVMAGASGRRSFTVTGTYGRADPDDPFWFGARTPFPDAESPDPLPVLMDRGTFLQSVEVLGLTPTFSWDAYLALTGLPFDRAETLPPTLERIEAELAQGPGLSSIRLETGIGDVLEVARQRVADLRVPILLVVFQIGAVALAVLAGVGALALRRQAFELSVLHSRGLSGGALLAAQASQAFAAAVVALPLGLGLGMALARIASRSNGPSLPGVLFPIRLGAGPMLLGVGVAALGVAILTGLSVPHVRRTVIEQRHAVSREERPTLLRVPVEVVVLPLGVFAFLQLRSGAAPAPGSGTIDPLVLLAPTLLVVAGSFLAIRALLLLIRSLDGVLGRTRHLPIYLAGRRIGRAPDVSSSVALLLLLSLGLLVVSSSYRATVLRNHADVAHHQVGSDWNLQVAPPDDPLAAIPQMPPGTTPVSRLQPSFEQSGGLGSPAAFGVDPATFAGATWWREDAAERPIQDLLREIESPNIGMPLPAGTLRAELEVPPAAAGLHLQVTTRAADGRVTTADLGALPDGPSRSELAVPDATTLLTVTFAEIEPLPDLSFELSIGIRSISRDGAPIDLTTWQPVNWRGAVGTLAPEGDGVRYDVQMGSGAVVGGLQPPVPALPAILSPAMVQQHSSFFSVTLGGQRLDVRQVGTATRFPTLAPDQPFLLVSLPALLERAESIPEASVGIGEVWARGPEDPAGRLEALGFVVGETRAAEPIAAGLAQLPRSLAVGMHLTAAASGIVLAVLGVSVGLYFAQRRREYETAALEAMGAGAGQVRGALLVEVILLVAFSAAAGLAIGYTMLRLTLPYVSKSLGFSYPEPVLVLDGTLLAGALLAIVVATGVALALALRAVGRLSVTDVLRGEAE